MNFLAKENDDRWHHLAWWLCVITLPWIDMANNISLILLALLCIVEGKFAVKWQRLKATTWIWPFLIYYLLLLIGMLYTQDTANGLFTLNKKITFVVLPIVAATENRFDDRFIGFLKRSFVYSCLAVILLCLGAAAYFFFNEGASANFDFSTNENFKAIHPDASQGWMHFSYIQLAHWAWLHPAYLSMYLVFCLVILITENYKDRFDQRIHAGIGFMFVCIITLLASRMAIITFVCSAIYLAVRKMQERNKGRITLIISCCFILGIFLWLNPVARFRVIEEPRMTNYQADRTVTNWNSVSFRLLEWEGSWSAISTNWFRGVGTGGWKLAMDNFYAHYNNSTVGLEHNVHNEYLQTWMENGLLGLFTFSACLWAGLTRLYKNSSYVSFILIFSLMCLTESIGERQKGIVFFMLFQVLFLRFEKRTE